MGLKVTALSDGWLMQALKAAAADLAGLYIHVPFCLKKCPYCDFYSVTDLELKPAYLRSVFSEVEIVSKDWVDLTFDSIYFGGGTPSLLSSHEIGGILEKARNRFRFSSDTEVTLEVNPGTVDPKSLEAYRMAGINRINIGVQSFNPRNLAFLGRIHTDAEAVAAIEGAGRAGFTNIGIDLIYGLPDQTEQVWLADLKKAVDLNPSHLSCYLLSYEPGTVLYTRRESGEVEPLPQVRQADLFLTTSGYLEDHGFEHYEVSNFARMGEGISGFNRSRHNQKYWIFASYAGLGPGAHSFRENKRWWNIRDIDGYLEETRSDMRPVGGEETLSTIQQQMEAVYLGLRRREGIAVKDFEKRFGLSFDGCVSKTAERLTREGFATFSSERFSLTRRGMLFLDGVAEALISCLP